MFGLDPIYDVPRDPVALGDEIARTAAHLDAATHRLLACIRVFDASEEWHRQGALSCAHWLAWRIGLDPGTAREKVRVARALAGLPRLDDGLRRGILSYAKVRALTRVATAENESTLAEMGRTCTGAQLELLCRRLRRVVALSDDGGRLDDSRYVKQESLASGMVRISAVLHPDEAELVMRAIEQARSEASARTADEDERDVRTADCRDPRDVPDVSGETPPAVIPLPDALVHVAQNYLAGCPPGGGSAYAAASPAASTASPAPPTVTPPRGNSRAQLFVHLDQDPLAADGVRTATLDDGTRISAETFRRLGCDATVVPVHHGRVGKIIGRRTRTVSPALRLALRVRDRGCRFPGCCNRRFVHAHHIHHWAHGGATTADNLVLLCSAHHRLVHEGGFTIQRLPDGPLAFADAHGRTVPTSPRPTALDDNAIEFLERCNTKTGLEIDADTSMPEWDGDAIDYEWAIDVVIRQGLAATDATGFPRVTRDSAFEAR